MKIKALLFFAVTTLIVWSCDKPQTATETNSKQEQTPSSFVKSEAKYAATFQLEYKEGYKLLHLYDPFSKEKNTETFVLLPKGVKAPNGVSKNHIIHIPVKNIITTTTAQTTMIEALGNLDNIKGYVSKDYMYSQDIVDRMDSGDIITVGYDIANNTETIISSSADLLMVVGSSTTNSNSFPILQKVGIPVIPNTDWQENHLLGRAEWIKVFGALLNKEAVANEIFSKVETRFNQLLALAKTAKEKPSVISGLPYKGMWSVPGGKSYLSIAFEQVRANYPWANTEQTGSIQLDLEGVFDKGGNADFWLNIGTLSTIEALEKSDVRYKKFKAFKNKELYNNNKRLRNATANDYWGTGILHPEYILEDLIKIFHPELLPKHELFFYHKLK